MLNPEELAAAQRQLVQSWHVMPRDGERLSYDLLLEELQERVLHLLRHQPRKLMTALYILDVPERRYLAAMDQPTMEDRAWDLARAILERESEKIVTRRKYGGTARAALEDPAPLPEQADDA